MGGSQSSESLWIVYKGIIPPLKGALRLLDTRFWGHNIMATFPPYSSYVCIRRKQLSVIEIGVPPVEREKLLCIGYRNPVLPL